MTKTVREFSAIGPCIPLGELIKANRRDRRIP